MSVTAVKWNCTANKSYGGVSSALANSSVVGTASKSSRDRACFSEQARKAAKAAQEAADAIAEELEKVEDKASSDKESGEEQKSMSDIIKEQMEKIDSMFSNNENKSDDRQLLLIKQKMRSGLSLNANEAKYLSKYDPDAYKNYKIVEETRRMYRCQLASCRTKDEVIGMRLSNALSALSAYKKAIRNGGDGAEVAGLNMALEREISSYAQTARFKNLPTAAERNKYQMELAKARKYEREKRIAERINATRKKKKQIKTLGDGKRTVAQVENSYLGRKIRKADAGGGSCGACGSSMSFGGYKQLDLLG